MTPISHVILSTRVDMASQNKDILLEGHPSVVVAIEEREELCMILFFLHLTSILYMIETVDMQPQFDNIVLASTTVIFPQSKPTALNQDHLVPVSDQEDFLNQNA